MSIHERLEKEFKSRGDSLVRSFGYEVLLSHSGYLVEDISIELSERSIAILSDRGFGKKLVKRVFFVLMESFQNIERHGFKDFKGGLALFSLYCREDKVLIAMLNIVSSDEAKALSKRIDFLNSIDNERLKLYYLKVLRDGSLSEKGGAGLGLISMARKTDGKLNYEVEQFDGDSSVFYIEYVFDV